MNAIRVLAAGMLATVVGVVPSSAQRRVAASATARTASATQNAVKPTIVLVHGAFADASGWLDLIPLLQRDGYKVVAVQNPLASLAGDVEWTKRVIDAQRGPLVVVGHSYGGAVISSAATGNANVKALVYIAAFAPDSAEPLSTFLEAYPTSLLASLTTDAAGFASIDVAKYHDVFAGDLSMRRTDAMAVTQKPISAQIFGQSGSSAAWKTIPSWFMVAQQDRVINPDLERFYAKRMRAHITEARSSHVAFISHAREVAELIVAAATASVPTTTAETGR